MQRFWWWLSLLIALMVLLYSVAHHGTVVLLWGGYEIRMTSYFALFMSLAGLFVITRLFRLWWWIRSTPRYLSEYRARSSLEAKLTLHQQMHLAYARGNYPEVEHVAERVIKMADKHMDSTLLLHGFAALEAGDYGEAQKIFDALYHVHPYREGALRGLVMLAHKQHKSAMLDQYVPLALQLLGVQAWFLEDAFAYYERQGDVKAALNLVTRAAEKSMMDRQVASSRKAAIYMEAAKGLLQQGETLEALRHLKAGHRCDPLHIPTLLLYAELLVYQGEEQKAWKLLLEAWEQTASAQLVAGVAKIFVSTTGNIRVRYYEKMVETHPTQPLPHLFLAREYLILRRFAEARRHALRSAECQPSAEAYILLAEIALTDSANVDEAQGWLRKIREEKE